MNRGRVACAACVCGAILAAAPARGQLFSDLVTGVEAAGFQVTGEHNPLTGGTFIQLDRGWVNEVVDFGAHQLTLAGQLRSRFETNTRFPGTLDFQLSTLGAPLMYTYVADTGGQMTTFTGNVLMDVNGSMNAFGFYNMRVNVSNREMVTAEGRFQNVQNQTNDFDIGPINIRGNIFADMLAELFDPIFQASGRPNIFASFSGRTQREQQVNSALARARQRLDQGGTIGNDQIDAMLSAAVVSEMLGDDVANPTFLEQARAANASVPAQPPAGLVPEPMTLVLLAPGVYWMLRRRSARA